MSVILVTHDLGVVAGHTDEIIVMYAGQIVEQAPTHVLFADMKMPYTEALLESIPKLDDPSHTRLRAIGGRPPDLINPPKGCRFSPRCPYVQDRCRRGGAAARRGRDPRPPLRLLVPGRLRRLARGQGPSGRERTSKARAAESGRPTKPDPSGRGRGASAPDRGRPGRPDGRHRHRPPAPRRRRAAAGRGPGGRVPRRPHRTQGPRGLGHQPRRAAGRDPRPRR